jgi:uncharacterized protein
MREDAENEPSMRAMTGDKKANRLGQEKSPYLLQHAYNPVDWYAWGEEAFEKARREDKPIFLSIGYSTCYWCHVMEREVFENEEIAALMNRTVVSIKVDREERPDIDQLYMSALQAMTGSGGWPMSLFMTAERKPFFAGTYFPPEDQRGRIGFPELLTRIHTAWKNDRPAILVYSEHITQFLIDSSVSNSNTDGMTKEMLDRGFEIFAHSFDTAYGGFGSAPKFPRPAVFNFLFRYYQRTGNLTARDMALTTLRKMAEGGICDQLGGGFHRYSTDEYWHVPHFEKMLYDQAQLVLSYLEAFQITHDPLYARVAREVLAYVQRVMAHPEGGFYSAEDAESASSPSENSQKKEGAFYIWKKSEIDNLLTDKEAAVIELFYGIRDEFAGENILFVAHPIEEIAQQYEENIEAVQAQLTLAKRKLFSNRELRPRPHLDDKILLSWNGLMISAFARAYCVLGDGSYLSEATKACRFLLAKLYDGDTGTLLRRFRDGEAKHEAQLADHAFLIQGMLDLYEASFNVEWLQTAMKLTDDQIRIFYDDTCGGFFEISGTDPTILVRTKEAYDGAEPSGNSIAILNLLRLSHIIDNSRYYDIAMQSLASFGERITKSPEAMPQFLVAIDFSLTTPTQIILAGKKEHPIIRGMLREIHSRFLPNKILLLADRKEGLALLRKHSPFFESSAFVEGAVKAYVCKQYACLLPASNVQHLIQYLDKEIMISTSRNDGEG